MFQNLDLDNRKKPSINTVDGRNPGKSLEVGSSSHYFHGFLHPRWLAGFLNHQQYQRLGKKPPGKSAGDQFGMMTTWLLEMVKWPPNRGSKGHGLNHLADEYSWDEEISMKNQHVIGGYPEVQSTKQFLAGQCQGWSMEQTDVRSPGQSLINLNFLANTRIRQLTLLLVWKGLVLKGWPAKIEVIWVPDVFS